MHTVPVAKVVSGGQTGVDRAALDVAMELGIPVGGWCPKGRRAEDGRIPERYPLRETSSWVYPQRTRLNVRDSDGTLVLARGEPAGGTALTVRLSERLGKPCLVVRLDEDSDAARARQWTAAHVVQTLNVAGPREGEAPGIYAQAKEWLARFLGGQPNP